MPSPKQTLLALSSPSDTLLDNSSPQLTPLFDPYVNLTISSMFLNGFFYKCPGIFFSSLYFFLFFFLESRVTVSSLYYFYLLFRFNKHSKLWSLFVSCIWHFISDRNAIVANVSIFTRMNWVTWADSRHADVVNKLHNNRHQFLYQTDCIKIAIDWMSRRIRNKAPEQERWKAERIWKFCSLDFTNIFL